MRTAPRGPGTSDGRNQASGGRFTTHSSAAAVDVTGRIGVMVSDAWTAREAFQQVGQHKSSHKPLGCALPLGAVASDAQRRAPSAC